MVKTPWDQIAWSNMCLLDLVGKDLHLAVNIQFSSRRLEPIMSGICSGWLTEVGGRCNVGSQALLLVID